MAVLQVLSPELRKRTRALNVHLVACFKINNSEYRAVLELATGPRHSMRPQAASLEGCVWPRTSVVSLLLPGAAPRPLACTPPHFATSPLSRNCLNICSPMEYELLKIIFIGCKNDGVIFGGAVSYGGLATDVFGALAPLLTELGREALGGDKTFECMVPAPGKSLPHGKYYYSQWFETATKGAAAFARCLEPTARRLKLECTPPAHFEEHFYSQLRQNRLNNTSNSNLRIPQWGATRIVQRMDKNSHSLEEFALCGYLLFSLGQRYDEEAILEAILLGDSLGRADMAVRLEDGTLVILEYDGHHWHGLEQVGADMAKTKRLLAIEGAIVVRVREGSAAPFPTGTGALVASVPTANPALAAAALVPLLESRLPSACASELKALADGMIQPLVDAEAKKAWAQVDVYGEKSAAGFEHSQVIHGRRALRKVQVELLEREIAEIGLLPEAARIEKDEELKALNELLRPIAKGLEIGLEGSFEQGSIGSSGTGAAALAQADKAEEEADGEDAKREVRRKRVAIEKKARGAATLTPHTQRLRVPAHAHFLAPRARAPFRSRPCPRPSWRLVHVQVESCRRSLMNNSRASNWDDKEDQLLRDAMSASGSSGKLNWATIAFHVPGRSIKQVQARWYDTLDPTINKDEWSEAEACRLEDLVEELGTKWAKIVEQLSGPRGRRTRNQAKNNYNIRRRGQLRAMKSKGI